LAEVSLAMIMKCQLAFTVLFAVQQAVAAAVLSQNSLSQAEILKALLDSPNLLAPSSTLPLFLNIISTLLRADSRQNSQRQTTNHFETISPV
jgi:hypothetical protein